ncbi:MAG: hypothetical protein M1142_04075 [Patescibacteria group bacterium]|nr:hypothetical protein [Patescibacteria group bacterium]
MSTERLGESPISWKLWTIPSDAKIILEIKRAVEIELAKRGGKKGPIDDLIIEDELLTGSRHDLWMQREKVKSPALFLFPVGVLRFLSYF